MIFLAGEKLLPLHLDGLDLEISPRSFFQLNTKQAIQLYRTIASMISGNHEFIVEAYSGIGAISLYLKDKAKEIIGIESIKDAVVNANRNAKKNGCAHVSFVCDDAPISLSIYRKSVRLTYWLSIRRAVDWMMRCWNASCAAKLKKSSTCLVMQQRLGKIWQYCRVVIMWKK